MRLAVRPAGAALPGALLGSLALCLMGGLVVGFASATYPRLLVMSAATAAAVALVTAIAIRRWRGFVYGLLLFLPFTGVPSVLMYPQTGLATLLKDILFVIPAYLGYAIASLRGTRAIRTSALPHILLWLLALLVLANIFNPSSPSLVVGLIGAKVWLFYMPLIYLGYDLVETKADLRWLIRLLCLVAIVPCLFGIISAVAIYSGHADQIYRLYGGAAESATQGFYGFSYNNSDSRIVRVPSTFAFVAQFTFFTSAMVALGYGWLRLRGKRRLLRAAVWVMFLGASLLTGSRGAFAMIPLLIALLMLFDRADLHGVAWAAGAACLFGVVLVVVSLLLQVQVLDFFHEAWYLIQRYVNDDFIGGLSTAFSRSFFGLGTGVDTAASRYATVLTDASSVSPLEDWYESWYAKAAFELGIPGLLALLALLGSLLNRAVVDHRRFRDADIRLCSSVFLALFVWIVLYSTKAQVIDFEPMNIYFWLFAGVALRLPALEREPGGPDSAADPG